MPIQDVSNPRNIEGSLIQPCCTDPITGYYRDGYCRLNAIEKNMNFKQDARDGYGYDYHDYDKHKEGDYVQSMICANMTQEFLDYMSIQRKIPSNPPSYLKEGM